MNAGHSHSPFRQHMSVRMITVVLLVVCAWNAAAQELERRESVLERARPGFDADGMRIGGWRLLPSVGLGIRYDDNIFAEDAIKQSDTAAIVSPELQFESRSRRYRAEVGANADIARYTDFSSEDYDDVRLWAIGGAKVRSGDFLVQLRLSDLHEERTSPDDVRGTELTKFARNSLSGEYTYRPGRWLARVDAAVGTLDFDSTNTPSGVVSNDDRDRTAADMGIRGAYSLSPDFAAFVEARIEQIDYDQQFDRNGFERSSDGGEARLGAMLDITGRTTGELFVSYLSRSFDDPRFGTVSGPGFGGEIDWNPTQLTTLTFAASREITPTTVVGAAGIVDTIATVGIDHELLRNLIVSATFSRRSEDFEKIDRKDKLSRATLGGTYLMNRYIHIFVGYRYRDRDTSPEDSGGIVFKKNELLVQVVGQL